MTLTEKWKKGELKQGEYWCKITESPYIERVYLPCCDDIIVEVLAPVPSYNEYQTVFNYATKYEVEYVKCVNDYEELRKENKQLEKKLEIAVKALEEYANRINWDKKGVSFGKYTKGWIMANKALAKIKEIK